MLPSVLVLSLFAAALPSAEQGEPGLLAVQQAAARAAGGTGEEDASRARRARLAHWAPQVRGQAQLRDDEKLRTGVLRLAPVREQDLGVGHSWAVVLSWDLSQVIYARDESQLALAHAHLARVRREAADKAVQLFFARRRAQLHWAGLPRGAARAGACVEGLQLTAELDALTAGLFDEAVSREEAECAAEESK